MSSVNQLERKLPFGTLVDEEVLSHVQQGNKVAIEYLINKYEGIVRKKASTYFLIGSDRDDVVQEGLIGLYKAICDYDENKRSSFRSFAELCITRQIITSIKSATRLKHTPLNSYVSIYKPVHDDESERMLLDTIDNYEAVDPHKVLVDREKYQYIQVKLMKALTRLEWNVLNLYVQGLTYEEIAVSLQRHDKSIDNALQRVKRKVEQLIEENDLNYI
ncbi:RNA polymerase sporulation sigma factor SigH [Pseudogracilibacillus auburnensis]|uniref:RNA polymerase sporulation sigma factor SigH n=1 Tax=Pseudogracilibacillus auburnensis TaxID=1494959 RepID=UPI001A9672AC|nr:RNA polymerase sporulation sigma factor SigH [Pseudogracilibacillus auburnensis]MBO1005164.1 RNA polymerase sporulation sigma factor SigH [Pseudogracilibacillus auburnensis]